MILQHIQLWINIVLYISNNILELGEPAYAGCGIYTANDGTLKLTTYPKIIMKRGDYIKRKTHREFIADIQKLVGNEYSIVDLYQSNKKEVTIIHKSKKCNFNSFIMKPNNFLNGQRCPVCSKRNAGKVNAIGIKELAQRVSKITGSEYEVKSVEYLNSKSDIKFLHTKCGRDFYSTPNNFLSKGSRCPKCSHEIRSNKLRKSIVDIKSILFNAVGDEYKLLTTEYINNSTKVELRHNICNRSFEVSIANFIHGGVRCTSCAESKGEQRVRYYLQSIGVKFAKQFCFDDLLGTSGRLLRFDFAVFNEDGSLQLLIEFDGRFHFEKVHENHDLEKQILYDKLKNQYCLNKNIKLVRIPYWEMESIEEILKSSIKL